MAATRLEIRPANECEFDLVSLGEVMLRLDPGEGRIRTARHFRVWEGGGEYNVARGLRRCFGLRTALVTAFADNEMGRLVEDLILQGGVDTRFIRWMPYDGLGRTIRNGLNFTERGFGIRGAIGCSDRGLTAASQLRPDDIDWDHLFGSLGVRWFHTGGIYAALSESTPRCHPGRGPIGPPAWDHGQLRSQLPAVPLGGDRRPRPCPTGQPADCEVRRCDDRQRGGLYGLPRSQGGRRRRQAKQSGRRAL